MKSNLVSKFFSFLFDNHEHTYQQYHNILDSVSLNKKDKTHNLLDYVSVIHAAQNLIIQNLLKIFIDYIYNKEISNLIQQLQLINGVMKTCQ